MNPMDESHGARGGEQGGRPVIQIGAVMASGDADRVPVPECHDGVCITCSDTAAEVTVVELLDHQLAIVDTGSGREEVSVALVSAEVGDTILVHASEAIAVLKAESSQA